MLILWLRGLRPAAQVWESSYAKTCEDVGCRRGSWASVAFWREERDVAFAVNGDDFAFSGSDEAFD